MLAGMATTHFKNDAVDTSGELPAVGAQAPEVELVGTDLSPVRSADLASKKVIYNIFPSVDTGVCAASVRRFNEEAAALDNTVVVCASQDLPFALGRFCGAEGIDNVQAASGFRSSFGEDFGLVLQGSPLQGLLARAVVVVDESGKVIHSQLVDEITEEPDYEAAIAAVK